MQRPRRNEKKKLHTHILCSPKAESATAPSITRCCCNGSLLRRRITKSFEQIGQRAIGGSNKPCASALSSKPARPALIGLDWLAVGEMYCEFPSLLRERSRSLRIWPLLQYPTFLFVRRPRDSMSDFYRPPPAVISYFFRHSATRAGGGGETTLFDVGSFFWPKLKHGRLSFTLFSACVRKKAGERESNFCVPCLISTNFPVGNKKPWPPLQRIIYFVALFRAQKLFFSFHLQNSGAKKEPDPHVLERAFFTPSTSYSFFCGPYRANIA